jgi:4'-phosphopantetheinyl transferase
VTELEVGRHLGKARTSRAEADLWFAWVGHHAGDVGRFSDAFLSSDERGRLRRFRSRDAAERYVVTRSLVRTVLARELRRSPRGIELGRTDAGKPVVTGGIHFNVSHSADLIVLAVSRTCDVGVDVERRRSVPRVEELSRRWLTNEERAEIGRLADSGRTASDAFLRVWTLKEARLKALGVGISGAAMTLDHLDAVSLDEALERLDGPGETAYVGAIAFA